MSVAQAQSLLSGSGATVPADAWGSREAGAQEGIAVFGYEASPQTSSATGEFYSLSSLMWSFSAFLLNTHLIFLRTLWYI